VFAWFRPTIGPTGTAAPATAGVDGVRGSLVCPECGATVRDTPPHVWTEAWGPRPSYAHTDGSPLCPVSLGYRPADPTPTGQARAARVSVPDGPAWPGGTAAAVRALTAAVHRLTATTASDGNPNAHTVTAALVATVHAVADCCHHLEAVTAAASDRAGRRIVQATGAAEHLVIRLIDVCTALDRR
jgi:hypothetical protein